MALGSLQVIPPMYELAQEVGFVIYVQVANRKCCMHIPDDLR